MAPRRGALRWFWGLQASHAQNLLPGLEAVSCLNGISDDPLTWLLTTPKR
ncbi:MAG: hypothetical protein QNK79_06780 [Synechococcus sp. ArSW.bin.68]